MKSITFLLTGFLATTHALKNYVRDGSFEQIPSSDAGTFNFAAGGWTFKESATVIHNSSATPYGDNYVKFFRHGFYHDSGSVTQQVKGLSGGDLTLRYAYRKVRPSTSDSCNLTASLGNQIIDRVLIFYLDPPNEPWTKMNTTFKPKHPGGPLSFNVTCFPAATHYEVDLDNISLTGPSSVASDT